LPILTNSALIGTLLIVIGIIVKFELKVITSEEKRELSEKKTENH
tara:strand:- start:2764 stop:2898 length:135 start_codon:yes stop_codon:yes gene_type:complete